VRRLRCLERKPYIGFALHRRTPFDHRAWAGHSGRAQEYSTMTDDRAGFAARPANGSEIETSTLFSPLFDAAGLIPAIVSDAVSGEMLMFAWMNAEALRRTLDTGEAWFWSRSRRGFWRKGEDSGNTLAVVEIRTDCDQDVIWLKVAIRGAGAACHTGARSCFYRVVSAAGQEQMSKGPTFVLIRAADTAPRPTPGTDPAAARTERSPDAPPKR